jgi:hypothetical protein
MGQAIYTQVQKSNKSARAMRIECQKQSITYERVYIKKDIKLAQKLLQNGNVKFSSSVEKAHYAKSRLFEYVKLEDMDKVLKNVLKQYMTKQVIEDKNLNIFYYIYENDVKDPGKKTPKSKLYAGYVVFRFYNQTEDLIYQVQLDFMDKKGADLPQRIKCAIKSFMTLDDS